MSLFPTIFLYAGTGILILLDILVIVIAVVWMLKLLKRSKGFSV